MNRRGRTRSQEAENTDRDAASLVQSVIICPTPEGGHIEHAADVGVALFEETGVAPILITRPGARKYLPDGLKQYVSIEEVLPPLSSAAGVKKVIHLVTSLIKEHFTIRSILTSITTHKKLLVLEEPRYPYPSMLGGRRNVTSVLIMHNAVSHSLKKTGSEQIKNTVASMCLRHVDRVVVHGNRQLRTVRTQTKVQVTSSPLPTSSRLPGMKASDSKNVNMPDLQDLSNLYICVGEIRENKGIEVAITASMEAGVSLVIAGKAVDASYLKHLKGLSQDAGNVVFIDRFLEVSEFEFLIQNADCILLPYTHFEAQSGVLARAINLGRPVIATHLPALEEQALGYAKIRYFASNDHQQLANLMAEGVPQVLLGSESSALVEQGERLPPGTWSRLARVLMGTEKG